MNQTNMNKNMTFPKGPLQRQSASPAMPGRKKDVRVFFFEENEETVGLSTGLKGQKLKSHISGMWKALTTSEKTAWKNRQMTPAWVASVPSTKSDVESATIIQKMWKTVKEVRKWRETRRWLVPYVVGMKAATAAKAAATDAMDAADRAIGSAAAVAVASEMAPKKNVKNKRFQVIVELRKKHFVGLGDNLTILNENHHTLGDIAKRLNLTYTTIHNIYSKKTTKTNKDLTWVDKSFSPVITITRIANKAICTVASEMDATEPKKKINVRTFYRVFFEKAVCNVLKLKGQKLKKHISGMWKALTKEEKAEWKWLSETMPMWLLDKSCAPDDAKYWTGAILVESFKKRAEMLKVIRETTGERWTFVRTTYYRFMDRPLRPICHWDPAIHKWRGERIDQIIAGRRRKCGEENEKTMAILETTRRVRYNHFKCCALITGHKSKISYALDSIFGTYEMSEEMMAEADKDWEKFMIAMYDMRDKPEWAHLVD